MLTAPVSPSARLHTNRLAGPSTSRKHGSTTAAAAVGPRAEQRRGESAQHVLAQKGHADGREVDAGLAHEVDAKERDEAHARGDRDEIRRHHDAYAAIKSPSNRGLPAGVRPA